MSDPTQALEATYYVTATSCTATDPGSGVLLSAHINDNNVSVTFAPNSTVVSSSVTTGIGCDGTITSTSGNVAGYNYGHSTVCSVSITLADGGSMSFNTTNDVDGFATSFTSVNLTAGPYPSWTVTAAPTPTSFSTSGQPIAYIFTLKNTGNVAISSISLIGTKTGPISCPAVPLAAGGTMTCTSSYTTIPGDVGAPIPYGVTATGTPAGGTLASAVANGSIAFTPQPALALTATPNPTSFTASGQAIAYNYTLTNTGNVTISSIAVTGTKTGSISCVDTTLTAGAITTCTSSYTTAAGDVGAPISYNAKATGTPTGGTLTDAVASGTIIFTAQPSLTIAATPNPTSFTNAGQAIAYSYKLTNTGNVTISSIAVAGTKTGTISCLAATLVAGASTTCTSSYTTVAGDVGAPIPYTATASGTPAGGSLANAVASGIITFTAQPALTIATTPNPTTFSKTGQVITYSYKVTNTGNVTINSLAVSDTKVSGITCPVTILALGANTTCSGTYTTTPADVLATSISSTATAQGMFTTTAVTSPPVTTTIQIDANAVRQATQSAIRNFMNRRAEMVTAMQPDESRKHQRLTGSLFGSSNEENDPQESKTSSVARGKTDSPPIEDRMARRPGRSPMTGDIGSDRTNNRTGVSPVSFNGSTDDDGGGRFAFATSLSKIRQANEAARIAQENSVDAPMGLGALQRTANRKADPSRFDFWAEGAMSYYSDTGTGLRQQGHAAVLFMGVDYRIHPAILVGALVQFDWMSETTSAPGTNASGQGWLAGPYVSVRLTPNLFFDARAAWGTSDNRIDPLGVYTDSFSTERSLVSAKLTGNWAYGQLLFRPSAEIVYFHETQKAYTNQINILIPEQSVSLGRVSAGPEIGYRFRNADGTTFEPFVGVKGVWDFDKTADTTVAGMAVGNDPFHVMVELGATLATPSGIFLRGSFAYDGVGDSDFRAYYGRGSLSIPFN